MGRSSLTRHGRCLVFGPGIDLVVECQVAIDLGGGSAVGSAISFKELQPYVDSRAEDDSDMSWSELLLCSCLLCSLLLCPLWSHRFQQLRVQSGKCPSTAEQFSKNVCYPQWSRGSDHTAPFVGAWTGTTYNYTDDVGRSSRYGFGTVATLPQLEWFPGVYTGDGYIFDFEKEWSRATANSALAGLMNDVWVDQSTRVVTVYLHSVSR